MQWFPNIYAWRITWIWSIPSPFISCLILSMVDFEWKVSNRFDNSFEKKCHFSIDIRQEWTSSTSLFLEIYLLRRMNCQIKCKDTEYINLLRFIKHCELESCNSEATNCHIMLNICYITYLLHIFTCTYTRIHDTYLLHNCIKLNWMYDFIMFYQILSFRIESFKTTNSNIRQP